MIGRNFDLASRKENTREKISKQVVRFGLEEILEHFSESMKCIDEQLNLADQLVQDGKLREAENIWRAQILFLAGALDFYMHQLTKYGLCEIYDENWNKTEKYKNIQVKMEVVEKALKSKEEDWFLTCMNDCYQTVTMVSFESVKEQLNLLGIPLNNVADYAFYEQGSTEKPKDKLKRRLGDLFYRRNLIVHQVDKEHTDASQKEIRKEMVVDFKDDIEKIVHGIHKATKEKVKAEQETEEND